MHHRRSSVKGITTCGPLPAEKGPLSTEEVFGALAL